MTPLARGIDAVLFDLDETLIVEEGAVTGAMEATAARVPAHHGVDPAALAKAVRATARSLWRAHPLVPWLHRIGISSWEGLCGAFEGPGEELAALRAYVPGYRVEVWNTALAQQGVRDEPLARTLAAHYVGEHGSRRVPYPETFHVLRALRGRVRLGMLTNGASDLQRDKERNAGLVPLFDAIVVSGDVGVGKPDARVFHALCDRLGVAPARCVMVGDNPERDVAGAHGVGAKALWIDRRGATLPAGVKPDARITSLAEVPGWLERASAGDGRSG